MCAATVSDRKVISSLLSRIMTGDSLLYRSISPSGSPDLWNKLPNGQVMADTGVLPVQQLYYSVSAKGRVSYILFDKGYGKVAYPPRGMMPGEGIGVVNRCVRGSFPFRLTVKTNPRLSD